MLTADQTLVPGKPRRSCALNIPSCVSHSSPAALQAQQQQLSQMLQGLQHQNIPASPLCYLGLITASGTVPPLFASKATVQYESAQVFGEEYHAQLDLPRISNYNVVCWCLWGPAMHFLAALTCCSKQISCRSMRWLSATSRMEMNMPTQEMIKEQSECFCL